MHDHASKSMTWRLRHRVGSLAAVLSIHCLCGGLSQRLAAAEFIPLGDLPGGLFESRPRGVSDDGRTVVGGSAGPEVYLPGFPGPVYDYHATREPFIWTPNVGMERIVIGGQGEATDVNAGGSVVVGFASPSDQAFRWTESEGVLPLGNPAGYDHSQAYGVSADGLTVVGRSFDFTPNMTEAFVWTVGKGMLGLGSRAGAADSKAWSVSSDGGVIVGGDESHAAMWTDRIGPQVLDDSGIDFDIYSLESKAVSPDGSVIVGWGGALVDNGLVTGMGWRWTAEEGVVLLDPSWSPASDGKYYPNAASEAGEYIVGHSLNAVGAFLWDRAQGIRSLQQVLVDEYGLGNALKGWTLTYANDISPNGRYIVGSGANANGDREAFLVRLDAVPEPASGILLLLGVGVSLACRKRIGLIRTYRRASRFQIIPPRSQREFGPVASGLIGSALALCFLPSLHAQQLEWIRQFRTPGNEGNVTVAANDLGDVFVAGTTRGSMGAANAGRADVFLTRLDEQGNPAWIRQFETAETELCLDVAADQSGNVYVTGFTNGSLWSTSFGGYDAFLAKYNSSGTLLWGRQFGGEGTDNGISVAVDPRGDVFVAGSTVDDLFGEGRGGVDGFIARFDPLGTLKGSSQFGTSGPDFPAAVAVDAEGNCYISGGTTGSLGGPNAGSRDAYLMSYSPTFDLRWTVQYGSSLYDSGRGVAADRLGNAYVTSHPGGESPNPYGSLREYDTSGALQWCRDVDTSAVDFLVDVAVDDRGNAWVAGMTEGDLGANNAGGRDTFVRLFDSAGAELWTRQFGTGEDDTPEAVCFDRQGSVYVAGQTAGSFAATNIGSLDAFVAKLRLAVSEPASSLLLAAGIATAAIIGRWRRIESRFKKTQIPASPTWGG